MKADFFDSASALWRKYLTNDNPLKIKILSQIVYEFRENQDEFPETLHIIEDVLAFFTKEHSSKNFSNLTREILDDIQVELACSVMPNELVDIPTYEFSRTVTENSFTVLEFTRTN